MSLNQKAALEGLRAVLRDYDLRDEGHGLGDDVYAAVRAAVMVLKAQVEASDDGPVMVRVDPVYVETLRSAEGLRGPFSALKLDETGSEPQLLLVTGQRAPLSATAESLIADLAECYRLTGADTDGDEDWRIAPHAVEEVRRLRAEYDALAARFDAPALQLVATVLYFQRAHAAALLDPSSTRARDQWHDACLSILALRVSHETSNAASATSAGNTR